MIRVRDDLLEKQGRRVREAKAFLIVSREGTLGQVFSGSSVG